MFSLMSDIEEPQRNLMLQGQASSKAKKKPLNQVHFLMNMEVEINLLSKEHCRTIKLKYITYQLYLTH